MKHGRHNKRAYETLKMLTKTIPRSTSIIEDRNGVPLAEDTLKLNRWTEYCKELYNYHINPDPSVLAHNGNHNTDTGDLKKCKNYRTLSLICHSSKILLTIILKRLNPQIERVLSEEQAGFRKRRSTVEQVFNCRNIIEKHLDSQKDLYHNFIDFKKAFDRVYHEGMWSALCKFGINNDIIMMIKSLYSTSAVLLNNMAGPFFNTTVGLRQGCLLSPTLFNIFLEEMMSEIEIKHATSISVGGRPILNLKFADDIDLLAGSNAELQHLTDELAKSTSCYGMEISAEKS